MLQETVKEELNTKWKEKEVCGTFFLLACSFTLMTSDDLKI